MSTSPSKIFVVQLLLVVAVASIADAFSVSSTIPLHSSMPTAPHYTTTTTIPNRNNHSQKLFVSMNRNVDDEEEEDDEEREYARVRRRGGGRAYYEDDDDDGDAYQVYSGRQRRGENVYDEELDDDQDEYYDDDDEEEDEEEYELFGNAIIPNPLLDSIDPDGAHERFPELARDPRFWFDMLLFVMFLDFLSYAGPRDPLPMIF